MDRRWSIILASENRKSKGEMAGRQNFFNFSGRQEGGKGDFFSWSTGTSKVKLQRLILHPFPTPIILHWTNARVIRDIEAPISPINIHERTCGFGAGYVIVRPPTEFLHAEILKSLSTNFSQSKPLLNVNIYLFTLSNIEGKRGICNDEKKITVTQ